MPLAFMSQVWFCLLAAFVIGLLVGWLGKKLSVSQKRPTSPHRDEVLAQNRENLAKERVITTQINALRTQVEIATTGVDSVTELTKCTAETLHRKFLDVNAAKRLSRILPILAQIRDWIEQAKDLPHSGKEPHFSAIGQTS